MKNLSTINILSKGTISQQVNSNNRTLYDDVNLQLRLDIAKVCREADSGHLGGSLSSIDLMMTLYMGGHLKFSLDDPRHPLRDRVLVRGHLGPLRYPLFSLFGWVDAQELETYRRLGSRLHGHESMHHMPGVDITPSGSLGMLLSYGVGASVVSKKKEHNFKTYVFLGDGEEQEGSVSEAARNAANLGLNNLVCILDQNGKQLSRATKDFNSHSDVASIWRGYGWNVIEIDNGHDPAAISAAYTMANSNTDKPTFIIARTIKGRGLLGTEEHFCGYHTISSCPNDVIDENIAKLTMEINSYGISRESLAGGIRDSVLEHDLSKIATHGIVRDSYPNIREDVASGMDFDDALTSYYKHLTAQLRQGNYDDTYVLTADLIEGNLIEPCGFDQHQDYFDVGLREQHMVAMAHGISITDPSARVHIHGGDAFAYRSLDQLNSAGQGGSNIVLLGDRSGIANARNGPTHQSVSQPFALNWQPNTKLLEPADVNDLYACLNYSMTENNGIYYIRSHSLAPENMPKANIPEKGIVPYYIVGTDYSDPDITVVSAGITTYFLWKAMEGVAQSGVKMRLVNIMAPGLLREDFAKSIAPDKPCLCVYNGHPDFLTSVISPFILNGKNGRPTIVKGHGFTAGNTGTTSELIKHFGFDSQSISQRVIETCRDAQTRNGPA